MRAVLDDGVAPPGRVAGGHRRGLGLRWGVRYGLCGERVGVGGAAVARPVPGAREEQGEDHGEGQHAGVAQHGEEHPAADQGEQHAGQGLAVHPAGEQLAHLVLVLVVVGDEEPGEAVEDEADAAGRRQDGERDPEDHRIHVALPPEPGAHPGEQLVRPVPPEAEGVVGGAGASVAVRFPRVSLCVPAGVPPSPSFRMPAPGPVSGSGPPPDPAPAACW